MDSGIPEWILEFQYGSDEANGIPLCILGLQCGSWGPVSILELQCETWDSCVDSGISVGILGFQSGSGHSSVDISVDSEVPV